MKMTKDDAYLKQELTSEQKDKWAMRLEQQRRWQTRQMQQMQQQQQMQRGDWSEEGQQQMQRGDWSEEGRQMQMPQQQMQRGDWSEEAQQRQQMQPMQQQQMQGMTPAQMRIRRQLRAQEMEMQVMQMQTQRLMMERQLMAEQSMMAEASMMDPMMGMMGGCPMMDPMMGMMGGCPMMGGAMVDPMMDPMMGGAMMGGAMGGMPGMMQMQVGGMHPGMQGEMQGASSSGAAPAGDANTAADDESASSRSSESEAEDETAGGAVAPQVPSSDGPQLPPDAVVAAAPGEEAHEAKGPESSGVAKALAAGVAASFAARAAQSSQAQAAAKFAEERAKTSNLGEKRRDPVSIGFNSGGDGQKRVRLAIPSFPSKIRDHFSEARAQDMQIEQDLRRPRRRSPERRSPRPVQRNRRSHGWDVVGDPAAPTGAAANAPKAAGVVGPGAQLWGAAAPKAPSLANTLVNLPGAHAGAPKLSPEAWQAIVARALQIEEEGLQAMRNTGKVPRGPPDLPTAVEIVDVKYIPYLVGKGGGHLVALNTEAGVSIHFDNSTKSQGFCMVNIYGTEENSTRAKCLISRKIAEYHPPGSRRRDAVR